MPTKYKDTSTYTEEYARGNIASFYDDIDMPGGYSWNHVETLKMIDLYYNSKYKTGSYDAIGLRKFFYNIVKPACDIATKFIDLDTKDITLSPEHPDDEFRVWVMQRRLKQYLKDSNFGQFLNDWFFVKPKYGSAIFEKNKKGEWETVHIQNFRFNTTVKKMCDSEYVYKLSSMSRTEIKKMKEWDKDAVKQLFERGYDQTFFIYTCLDKTESGWHRTVRADLYSTRTKDGIDRSVESEINNRTGDYYGALVLFEDDLKEEAFPYREDHYERVPGRWLGYGFVEYLEENQIAMNEAENLERKGLIFSSLKIFQTRDEEVAGSNILSVAQNGHILKVESEITQIDVTERNLGAFNNTRSNWTTNTERKTFTTDITTGANLPSRTPLGVANLQASFASSYFELKREGSGLTLKQLILKDILPDFEKDTQKEHILTFLGSDKEIDRLDQMITQRHLDDAVLEYAEKTGYFPSQEERARVKADMTSQLKKMKNRYLKIGEGYYRNAKYIVDVNITGESMDNGAKSQVIQMALQLMSTNPAIMQNPSTKGMFMSLLALGGINPIDIGLGEGNPEPQPPQQPGQPGSPALAQGGSISVPQAQASQMANTQTY